MAVAITLKLAQRVIAEAVSWIGTPYHNCANVKGAGCDCVMLLVEVYKAAGVIPADFPDPRPYAPHWFLHHEDERYIGGLEQYCDRVEIARPADVALFRYGKTASHGAIVVDDEYMIHAFAPAGMVERIERRALANYFDSYWSMRA